ncbi:hypothetical protein AAG906_036918 [Vitis piasezkii]
MEFGAREVAAEAPEALLAAPEMAPEMELVRVLGTAPLSFCGAGFAGGETTFGRGGSEVGSGTGSPRGTLLRLEGEEDLAHLVHAISDSQNLVGSDDRRR